jgi:hypothetical protein
MDTDLLLRRYCGRVVRAICVIRFRADCPRFWTDPFPFLHTVSNLHTEGRHCANNVDCHSIVNHVAFHVYEIEAPGARYGI